MQIQPDAAESCAYLAKDLVLTLCLPREGPCAHPPTSLGNWIPFWKLNAILLSLCFEDGLEFPTCIQNACVVELKSGVLPNNLKPVLFCQQASGWSTIHLGAMKNHRMLSQPVHRLLKFSKEQAAFWSMCVKTVRLRYETKQEGAETYMMMLESHVKQYIL